MSERPPIDQSGPTGDGGRPDHTAPTAQRAESGESGANPARNAAGQTEATEGHGHPGEFDQPGDPTGTDAAAAPAGLGAMLEGLDFGSLFGAASEMLAAQQANVDEEILGSAGGGAVQIRVTGGGEFLGVRIAPELVDPQDVSLLEDTVLAALRDTMERLQQMQSASLGGLGGMDALAGLSGLLGSAGLGSLGGSLAADESRGDHTP